MVENLKPGDGLYIVARINDVAHVRHGAFVGYGAAGLVVYQESPGSGVYLQAQPQDCYATRQEAQAAADVENTTP
jgi:hypothetical protein